MEEATREPAEAPAIRPRAVLRTGDDTPARSVWRYIWRMSGWHQLGVCGLAAITAAVGLVPIELQRRIIDDAITPGDVTLLAWLGATYAAAILLHQAGKVALGLYQGWISESAVRYTRGHLMSILCRREAEGGHTPGGQAVSVINAEVDKLGGFVGEGVAQATVSVTMLIGVFTYMIVIEPRIAAFALLFLVPQAILTPLVQRKLNRLTEDRLGLLRGLGDIVASGDACTGDGLGPTLDRVYGNRIRFYVWKNALKAALNLLNAAGPLAVLAIGGWLAIQGETTVGVIVAFVSGFQRLADPVRQLLATYRLAAQARVQHEMIARWM